jgi:hypothetical protein
MLAEVTHILPVTLIRRERLLPVPGKILVRAGQKVISTDVVAEASLSPEHFMLDVARSLGVTAERSDQYLQVQPGTELAEKDVVAGPVGLGRRVVRAPRAGKVVLAGGGQVLIEAASRPYQLKAGIPGEVVELVGEMGVVIETTGALIQAVWGNGGLDSGVLTVVCQEPAQLLTASQLDVALRGSILLAACCSDREVFKAAAELPLRGLVLASMDASLLQAAEKCPIPVLVLDGFGRRPMNSVAYKLLTTNNRRDVVVNGQRWNRYSGLRPELIIPLPASGNTGAPPETGALVRDMPVRILRAPYANLVGLITGIQNMAVMPSGVRGRAAEVRLESGETVVVPLANLELLV